MTDFPASRRPRCSTSPLVNGKDVECVVLGLVHTTRGRIRLVHARAGLEELGESRSCCPRGPPILGAARLAGTGTVCCADLWRLSGVYHTATTCISIGLTRTRRRRRSSQCDTFTPTAAE